MRDNSYRPDIDGLRAISVMAIFAFHLGFSGFSGGFVGVDIFFVISGYLIVPKIADGLWQGNFSLVEFFEKRARRILPALILVLVFSFVVGFFVLGPREYREFALSAFATIVFGANIFFSDRSDYFADAAHQKPFLHAWSLGIEEQFYILIPLILMACWAFFKFSPKRVILVITIASFIYNVVFIRIDETHTFYLPMSRFWELGLGGLIALYTRDLHVPKWGSLFSAFIGLILLGIAIFAIDDQVRYPGEAVLLPVIGAAFLIFSGQYGLTPINRILGTLPFRYIGRLSYSIYLIHWPVIVFTRLYLSRPLELTEQIMILLFSILWAALSWQFMERKVLSRTNIQFGRIAAGLVASLAVCLVMAGFVAFSNGIPSRMSDKSLQVATVLEAERRGHKKNCDTRLSLGDGPYSKYKICQYGDKAGKKILFLGDSHSGMILGAYYRLYGKGEYRVSSAGIPDCPPLISVETTRRKNREICRAFVDRMMFYIDESKTDIVVIASRWANLASDYRSPGDGGRSHTIFDLDADRKVMSLGDALTRTINRISKSGARTIIVGPVPEIPYHVPDTLVRSWSGIGVLPDVKKSDFDLRQAKVMSALTQVESQTQATVIYPHEEMCDSDRCYVSRNGLALYTDDDHLSVEGARSIVDKLRQQF